jgi:hypothetical protein
VLVHGSILNFTEAVNPYDPSDVWSTGIFSYFWLTNGAQCALCGTTTMVTFIVTPLTSAVCCFLFSAIDVKIRGEV